MTNKYLAEFNSLLNQHGYKYHTIEVFRDFCRMAAIALSSPFYNYQFEQEYKEIIEKYEKKEQDIFPKMLFVLTNALQAEPHDFLGEAFMSNDLGSSHKGQFFTPLSISELTAAMSASDLIQYLEKKEYVTLSEPACGSGSMIIALIKIFIEKGLNHSRQLYVEAKDIDSLCADMTYIQLSLLGVSATVIWGDTLACTTNRAIQTPIFFIERWSKILKSNPDKHHPDFMKTILELMKKAGEHSNNALINQHSSSKVESL